MIRFASKVAVALAMVATLPGCPTAKPPTTSLRLAADKESPPRAHVTIDDEPIGSLAYIVAHGVALPPGKHRITIEAEGYLPWDMEVDAGDSGGLIKLDVGLVKKPE